MARAPLSLLPLPLAMPALALLLAGCQAWPLADGEASLMEDPLAGAPPIERGLDAEGLAGLLTAELAGQRGDYRRAAEGYLTASERYRNAGLAERAALAASFGNERELLDRAARAGRAWRPAAPLRHDCWPASPCSAATGTKPCASVWRWSGRAATARSRRWSNPPWLPTPTRPRCCPGCVTTWPRRPRMPAAMTPSWPPHCSRWRSAGPTPPSDAWSASVPEHRSCRHCG